MTAGGVGSTALVAIALVLASERCGVAGGDRELGEYLSSECVTCHQLSGKYDGIPPIIGWPSESFIEVLTDYRDRSGARTWSCAASRSSSPTTRSLLSPLILEVAENRLGAPAQ